MHAAKEQAGRTCSQSQRQRALDPALRKVAVHGSVVPGNNDFVNPRTAVNANASRIHNPASLNRFVSLTAFFPTSTTVSSYPVNVRGFPYVRRKP